MNKFLFISLIGTVLVIILGIWVYLMFNGTPASVNEIFTNFGQTQPSPERPVATPQVIDNRNKTTVDTSSNSLNQLTTKAVAGYIAFTGSSSDLVRFVEKGTGYVFDINLNSGVETRRSGTTFNRVVDATFSPDGNMAVLTTENEREFSSSLVLLATSSSYATVINLPERIANIFADNSRVYYTKTTDNGTSGYVFDPNTEDETPLFSTSLHDISVIWNSTTPHIINKPAATMRGSLYAINNSSYTLLYGPEYGLIASASNNDNWVLSAIDTKSQQYKSFWYNDETNTTLPLAVVALPEKCALGGVQTICLSALYEDYQAGALTTWLQGTKQFNDAIWSLDTVSGNAELLISPSDELGYPLDGTEAQLHTNRFFFINRNNQTLWSYTLQ